MANIKSLSDLNGEDSDDNKKHNDYYAGGEKSGQLIRGAPEDEDSDEGEDRVGGIFRKAKAIGAQQGTAGDMPEENAFRGQGRTLEGGPSAQAAAGGSNQHNHVVKFYRNGIFTVDDGAPRHMDDAANLDFINSVSRGECPRELDPGDSSVEVTVNMLRAEEDYVMPKYVAFSGAGRTLGASSGAGSSQAAAAAGSAPPGEWEGVDESQPTTSIQLRLSDGSRMVARMNHTHTVADIRRFIRASRPDMAGGYTLATGFPPAPIADENQSLEAAGLLNAVINQRKA
ncbi:ubiquitin-related domain-containing protein [Scenedesmus sp. NREL 46B-D3]|nr:ubiquitin-related domain-containing protein [Scenedesmus sp. NREL 46B-D3]